MKITRTLEDTMKITGTERGYVEDWLRDADAAQEFPLLVTQRWWSHRRRFGELERELVKFMREDEESIQRDAQAPRIADWYRYVRFRRGK